jgi:hypothetical protein
MNALGADIMGEDLAELVFGNLTEIGSLAAEIRDPGRRIAGASAGGFQSRAHARIEKLGALGVYEVHRGFGDVVFDQKLIVATGDNVDDSIADGQYIEASHL